MGFWAAAQLRSQRESLALHLLDQAGFVVWTPRIRERRIIRGRRQVVTPALFPGYTFVYVELQWHAIRRTPYVIRLVMDGERPARVPDRIIEELRGRERNGTIELPQPPPKLRSGARVRVTGGRFQGHLGLVAGMAPRERVVILLSLLGGQQRVSLPEGDVEAV
jgi:transcriptional antiterminator RfaH